jgi:hypothetical protein
MTEDQIKHMVVRFLNWRLPENFRPDAGISFKADFNEHTAWPMKHKPAGTNLFDAVQAEAMVRHMVEGIPSVDADMLAALKAIRAHRPDHADNAWDAVDEAISQAERTS